MKHLWNKNWHPKNLPSKVRLTTFVVVFIILGGSYLLFNSFAATPMDTTPPSAPQNVSVTNITKTSARLEWAARTDNNDFDHYTVYLYQAEATPIEGIKLTASTTSYTFDNLMPDSDISIRLSAADKAGNASDTYTGAHTLADTTQPTAPAHVRATFDKVTNKVIIKWEPSSDESGIVGYSVYRFRPYYSLQEKLPPVNPDTYFTTTSSTYIDNNPPLNEEVKYQVMTHSGATGAGASNRDSVLSASTEPRDITDNEPPTNPANLKMTAVTSNSVSLGWTFSTDNFKSYLGTYGLKFYRIYRNGSMIAEQSTATGSTYYSGGLNPGTPYTYYVTAVDSNNNESGQSNSLSVTTTGTSSGDNQAPTAPSELKVTRSGGTANLTWKASTDDVGVTSYTVKKLMSGTLATYTDLNTTTSTSYSDTSAAPNQYVTYVVSANDSGGNASPNSNASTVLMDSTAPTAPSGLYGKPKFTATNCQAGSTKCKVELNWNASTDNVGLNKYIIVRNGAEVGSTIDKNSYIDGNAPAGTSVNYVVRASDAAGNYANSSAIDVSTADTADPIVHINTIGPVKKLGDPVEKTIGGPVNVNIFAEDNAGVTKSELYIDGELTSAVFKKEKLLDGTVNPNSYDTRWNTYSVANGPHVLTVRVYDAAGHIRQDSKNITVLNPETQRPSWPSSCKSSTANNCLSFSKSAPSQIILKWTPVTDNAGGGYYIMRGNVMVGQVNTSQLTLGSDQKFSYPDSKNLLPSTGYTYYIYAYDAAGNVSEKSNSVSASTAAAASVDTELPIPPGKPNTEGVTGQQINLSWTASTDNVGVDHYSIWRCMSNCSNINGTITGTFGQIGTSKDTNYNDATLTGETTQYYQIKAHDAKNNASMASAASSGHVLLYQDTTNGSITGYIYDSTTKLPLTLAPPMRAYVQVKTKVTGTDKYPQASTRYWPVSATGFYALTDLSLNTVYDPIITVIAIGYTPITRQIHVDSNNTVLLNIPMTKSN